MTVKVEKIEENADGSATLILEIDEKTEEIIRKFYNTTNLTEEMVQEYIKRSLAVAFEKEVEK